MSDDRNMSTALPQAAHAGVNRCQQILRRHRDFCCFVSGALWQISFQQGAVVRLSNLDNLFDAFLKLRLDAGLTCNRMCIAAAFVLYILRRRHCQDFRRIFLRQGLALSWTAFDAVSSGLRRGQICNMICIRRCKSCSKMCIAAALTMCCFPQCLSAANLLAARRRCSPE